MQDSVRRLNSADASSKSASWLPAVAEAMKGADLRVKSDSQNVYALIDDNTQVLIHPESESTGTYEIQSKEGNDIVVKQQGKYKTLADLVKATTQPQKMEASKKTVLRAGKHYQEAVTKKLNASKQSKDEGWVTTCIPADRKHARRSEASWATVQVNASKSQANREQVKTAASRSLNRPARKTTKLQASCTCGEPGCPVCQFNQIFPTVVDGCQSVNGFLFNKPDNITGTPALYIAYYDSFEDLVVVSRVDTVNDGGIFSNSEDDLRRIFPHTSEEWDVTTSEFDELFEPGVTPESEVSGFIDEEVF